MDRVLKTLTSEQFLRVTFADARNRDPELFRALYAKDTRTTLEKRHGLCILRRGQVIVIFRPEGAQKKRKAERRLKRGFRARQAKR